MTRGVEMAGARFSVISSRWFAVLTLVLCVCLRCVEATADALIGYYESSGVYTAQTCDSTDVRFSSANYACCVKSDEPSPKPIVGCTSGTVYEEDGVTQKSLYTCPGNFNFICHTKTIYKSYGASDSILDYACSASSAATLYLTPPPGATVIDTFGQALVAGSGISAPPRPTNSGPSTLSTAIPGASSGAGPTSTNSPPSSGGSSNRGWIAAAVIGPIALLVIAGLGFWIYHLRRSKAALVQEQYNPNGIKGHMGYVPRAELPPAVAEMPNVHAVGELPTEQSVYVPKPYYRQ